jgi:hypothetical protein
LGEGGLYGLGHLVQADDEDDSFGSPGRTRGVPV